MCFPVNFAKFYFFAFFENYINTKTTAKTGSKNVYVDM